MVSTSKLTGTWQGGGNVGDTTEVVIALYANALRVTKQSPHYEDQYHQQMASFAILREWVRQHLREKPEMERFMDGITTIDGRGYLFELYNVAWGNETSPFYLLIQRTLKEMAETFNCDPHSNCSTPYALEYSWVKGNGMAYDTVRLGNYAYAVGVKVETEVAHDYMMGVVHE
jgi:hypothetical protein